MGVGIHTDTSVITAEIHRLIAEIDEIKDAWVAIGRISPDRLTALRRVATVESIGSSTRIEGAKPSDNHVEAFRSNGENIGIVFETATPFDTPSLMEELIEWAQATTDEGELHPLICISLFVVVFLEIHPFQDGNGRLSRILTTLMLLRAGYQYVPYSSQESVTERSKEAYYLVLRQTQASLRTGAPNWQPWLTFFLKSLHG